MLLGVTVGGKSVQLHSLVNDVSPETTAQPDASQRCH